MAANHILLERIVTSSEVASIVFDSIPQTGYTDLIIKVSGRTIRTAPQDGLYMVVNTVNSTGFRNIEGNGTTATSVGTASYGNNWVAYIPGGDGTANSFSNTEIYITDYSNTSVHKSITSDSVMESGSATSYMAMTASIWPHTSSVNNISFGCNANFAVGTTFSLYGVAAVGSEPVTLPFASGGDIVNNDGTYWYHAFISSGTFIPNKTLSCDYLVVAGGGGGGNGGSSGGGGGAGGYRTSTGYSTLANTDYLVTIGAGGNGTGGNGTSGSNSVFDTITSTGGGFGGAGGNSAPSGVTNGGAGGSGGGGGGYGGGVGSGFTGGAASPSGQGNAGGNGVAGSTNYRGGGGGGGAGATGASGSGGNGGNGGAGLNTLSTWFSTTGTGVSGYVAGGGGSGTNEVNTGFGTGGAGGGGRGGYWNGSSLIQPVAGTANTGSGGGGGGSNGANGARGGSGIVIVRYPMV
jgi:hypothetical protein